MRQRGQGVGLHVEKSLLCHFKTLCWSHVLHLAQKRVHFLQKHIGALVRLALQQPDRRGLRSRTPHSKDSTQPRVWRGLGACVWGKLAREHGTCEGAGVMARVRLLPAGGSPRFHSMFCQRARARMDNKQRDSHFAR